MNIEFDWKVILVVFWVPFIYLFVRDIIGIIKSKKGIKKHTQQLIESEKKIIEKMKDLEKSRQEITQQMVDLDKFMTESLQTQEKPNESQKVKNTDKDNTPQSND